MFSCSGMDRIYENFGSAPIEDSKISSTKESIVDPVDFVRHSGSETAKKSRLFIGRNNTEIWAHQGSNVVFDCLVGRPNLEDQGPVSLKSFRLLISLLRVQTGTNYSGHLLRFRRQILYFILIKVNQLNTVTLF